MKGVDLLPHLPPACSHGLPADSIGRMLTAAVAAGATAGVCSLLQLPEAQQLPEDAQIAALVYLTSRVTQSFPAYDNYYFMFRLNPPSLREQVGTLCEALAGKELSTAAAGQLLCAAAAAKDPDVLSNYLALHFGQPELGPRQLAVVLEEAGLESRRDGTDREEWKDQHWAAVVCLLSLPAVAELSVQEVSSFLLEMLKLQQGYEYFPALAGTSLRATKADILRTACRQLPAMQQLPVEEVSSLLEDRPNHGYSDSDAGAAYRSEEPIQVERGRGWARRSLQTTEIASGSGYGC